MTDTGMNKLSCVHLLPELGFIEVIKFPSVKSQKILRLPCQVEAG
jgi:hypothetical protein